MASIKTLAEEYDKRFEALQHVISYLHYADSQHLGVEWLDSFLDSYTQDQDVMSAIHHANREWDL